MIHTWKYNAITRMGQEVAGIARGAKTQVISDLARQDLYVIDLTVDYAALLKFIKPRTKVSTAVLSQFFEDFYNMYLTGMGIPQILQSLKETTKEESFIEVISAIEDKVRQGDALTQAMSGLNVFPWIVPATLHAGERTGKLQQALKVLSQYFRRSGDVQEKLTSALTYPLIVFVLLVAVMMFVGLKVVPQLQNLLPMDAVSHGATRWVLLLSRFLQKNWFFIFLIPVVSVMGLLFYRRNNKESFECWLYQWPVIGSLIKESAMSFYFLNLSVLLKSGVPLLQAISDLNVMCSSQVSRRFLKCRDYMFGGMCFWESVKQDGFFPLFVIFTIRRAEEMAKLDEYCFNLSEYYNKRVGAKVDGLIHLIQPVLLAFGGLFLVLIAVAFLIPIYGSLSKIAGGG